MPTTLLQMTSLSKLPSLEDYNYILPPELIANEPVEPRDTARLFVYDTKTGVVSHRQVKDLPEILPISTIVYNDTTVLPARLRAFKDSEDIEMLVLVDQGISEEGKVRALVNKRVRVGEMLTTGKLHFVVLEDHDKSMLLQIKEGREALFSYLEEAGETPLPPYLKSSQSEEEKRVKYQTIFAAGDPSVAAPTASLHFTKDLVSHLERKGNKMCPLTLQVGLGTFAPIFPENFVAGKLHSEFYSVGVDTAAKIQAAYVQKQNILAIGTTSLRVLEAAKVALLEGQAVADSTDIFIFPPYKFTLASSLLTNFHVPKSSLMCLVEAFIKDKGGDRSLIDLYAEAIEMKYRFYSFGDAMLIL